MYGKYELKLLIAVGFDGNNNILPLAFAIIDKESKIAWKWFLKQLGTHVVKERTGLCLISDRALGILHSISELRRWSAPRGYHRFCLRHVKSNFLYKFPNNDLGNLMWKAATQHQLRKFEETMEQIREMNHGAYDYLMNIPLDKWTLAHDGGKRWGVTTTNLSESFNGLLRKARGLPVTAMVRVSLAQLVERFIRRYKKAVSLVNAQEIWTETFKKKWEALKAKSMTHRVTEWGHTNGVYEVTTGAIGMSHGNAHKVAFNDRKCDCGKWQIYHYPCSHVLKVTQNMVRINIDLTPDYFMATNYLETYSTSFSPVGHEAYWPAPNFRMKSNELYRREDRRGRYHTQHIPNEMDRPRSTYKRACGLCKQTGHNRRRCPLQL